MKDCSQAFTNPRMRLVACGLQAGLYFATLALFVACSTSGTSGPVSSFPPSRTASASDATPTPEQLPPLVLDASLDHPPVRWREVAFLPGGDAEEQVGLDPCFECEPVVPPALAVDKDGSFWIADSFNRRIAHFAHDGSFLEAIPVDRGPADLTFVGDRLYALLEENRPMLVSVRRGHLSKPITVNDDGRPLHVEALIGGQDHLLVLIAGAAKLLGGYWVTLGRGHLPGGGVNAGVARAWRRRHGSRTASGHPAYHLRDPVVRRRPHHVHARGPVPACPRREAASHLHWRHVRSDHDIRWDRHRREPRRWARNPGRQVVLGDSLGRQEARLRAHPRRGVRRQRETLSHGWGGRRGLLDATPTGWASHLSAVVRIGPSRLVHPQALPCRDHQVPPRPAARLGEVSPFPPGVGTSPELFARVRAGPNAPGNLLVMRPIQGRASDRRSREPSKRLSHGRVRPA